MVWCGVVVWCSDRRRAQDGASAQRVCNVDVCHVKDASTLSNVTDDEDYDPRSNPGL